MFHKRILITIGALEILIGSASLIGLTGAMASGTGTKEFNILAFVFCASFLSTAIGFGILRFNKTAGELLAYFSSVIVLSKILIFTGIISLNGSLEGLVPVSLRNIISIFYHSFIIYYLRRKDVRALFAGTKTA